MLELSQYNTRTNPHQILEGTTNTNSVNIGLTTRCTMRCPMCTIDIPALKESGKARDASSMELVAAQRHLRGLRRIHLTGGEPTLHEGFEFWARSLKSACAPEYYTIEMNGHGYSKYRNVFLDDNLFDLVFITHYLKDAVYPGSPDNTAIIEEAQQELGKRLIVEEPVTHDRRHLTQLRVIQKKTVLPTINYIEGIVDESYRCGKFDYPGLPAGYYNGLIYPCCVTFGIDAGLGFALDENWKTHMENAVMGCKACAFGERKTKEQL